MMRGTLLNKLWTLFLFVFTVAGTLVTGVTSIQVLPCCCDMYALIGMTSVTAVCASRLFSQSLLRAFVCGAVTPPVTSGVSAGLYVLYVPLPPDVPDYFGTDMPAALLDGILAAVITFPIGCLSAACCVGILRVRDGFRRGHHCHSP
jgi:hypothetical protein